MNGFLVVIRHTMDDFPLRLFTIEQQVEAYAFPCPPDILAWSVSAVAKGESRKPEAANAS